MRRAEQISRRLKLRHLNAFVAVVEHRSMVKAAKYLSISQPVVSKAIADLEDMVGVRLLERGPQGIEPTIYGRALLKRSVSVFDDLRTGMSELEFLADPCAGELRIGTTEAMGTTLVPTIINRLSRKYPRIAFEVVIASPGLLQDRELRGRRVDLIIGPITKGVSNDLDVTVLYRDRLQIVAGKTNPWTRRRKIALGDLVDERWVLPAQDHQIYQFVIDAFQRAGLRPPQSVVTVTSAPFTSRLIAGGQFLGVLAAGTFRLNDSHSPLKILPVELPVHAWPVSAVTLKNRAINPVAQLFVDCAQELAKPLTNWLASNN